ncbi:GGDEF domain-containing protein [Parachitinimonas caeni]|uniref:diguanylate cyclase n=1 Tax=Parachitinimonas caeni TaxID=3031301 RepID=A0ABT7DST6_9NEIS|nr:GGDEF domain-containing protein [Parachitinimonas caeni]MDK2122844.1 diguanylate cyclase [Parachitinimonas caeni]
MTSRPDTSDHDNFVGQVVNSLQLGVMVFNASGQIALWNRWLEEKSGKPAEQMLGRNFVEAFPYLARSRVQQSVQGVLTGGFPVVLSQSLHRAPFDLYQQSRPDEEPQRIQQAIRIAPLLGPDQRRWCLLQIEDVTQAVHREEVLWRQAEQLTHHSYHDALTNLPNRRRLMEYLEHEWGRARRARRPLAVLMVDIDHFKKYNDALGHQAGDRCLVQIAHTLQSTMRRASDLITRYGGEEFVAVLPETDNDGALQVAHAMLSAVATQQLAHPQSATGEWVTVSIGIACNTEWQDVPVCQLIEAADLALYRAKAAGRCRISC